MLVACETGKGSVQYSNEVIHLAAVLYFAGFRSIISTMWSISDNDGPLVAQKVYDYIFQGMAGNTSGVGPDSSRAAYALRATVRYMRDAAGRSPLSWAPFVHFGL
jgi:CHAT domain-containing protein